MKSSETAKEDDIFLRFQRIFLAFFKREGALRRFFAPNRAYETITHEGELRHIEAKLWTHGEGRLKKMSYFCRQ